MKAISIRQPWTWAILRLGQDVENRPRNIAGDYRGPLVIHASKKPLPVMDESRDFILHLTGRLPLAEHPSQLGAALGVVDLVYVHHALDCGRACSPWAMGDQHHLVLTNPRIFAEPIPYRGALGLWDFPDELLPEGFR